MCLRQVWVEEYIRLREYELARSAGRHALPMAGRGRDSSPSRYRAGWKLAGMGLAFVQGRAHTDRVVSTPVRGG